MSEPTPEYTDEMAAAKWVEIAPLIDVLIKRIQDPNDFAIAEGSSLALDDAASKPYHVSHCVRWGITAGIEHLHAVKTLVFDAHLTHPAADYTLIRGALENLAAAYWILHPEDRKERVERALRWWAKNYKDQHTAIVGYPEIGGALRDVTLPKVVAVGEPLGCSEAKIKAGYTSTEAVEYAEENSSASIVLFSWRLCSGFAHSRPWAHIGMNERTQVSTVEDGVSQVSMTTDPKRILTMVMPAIILLQDLLRLRDQRAAGPQA